MNDKARILRDYVRLCNNKKCDSCGLSQKNNGTEFYCQEYTLKHPEKAVEIIEAWAKEHPEKTYRQDVLEKFPNSYFKANNVPSVCRRYLYGIDTKPKCDGKCYDCWNEPMEG